MPSLPMSDPVGVLPVFDHKLPAVVVSDEFMMSPVSSSNSMVSPDESMV